MDISDFLTTAVASITGVAATLVTLAPKLAAARKAIAPLLGRKSLRVLVLTDESRQPGAVAFAESLRRTGYREVAVSRSPHSAVEKNVVIVWHPDPSTAADTCAQADAAAPEAIQLVLTHPRLDVELHEKRLLSQSEIRLRGDLATIAEVLR